MRPTLYIKLFLTSILMVGGVYAQPKVDSVVIEIKNIPSHFHHENYLSGGHDRNKSISDNDGLQKGIRRVIYSPTVTLVGNDSMIISGNAYWNGFQTLQKLTLVFNYQGTGNCSIYFQEEKDWQSSNIFYKVRLVSPGLYFSGQETLLQVNPNDLPPNVFMYTYSTFQGGYYITKESSNSLGTFTDSSYFSLNIVSGQPLYVKQNNESLQSVYPNPASNSITALYSNDSKLLMFFDQLGREVHIPEISRTNELVSFNTSSLIPGIYWLRIGSQTQKIVIQR